MYVITFYSFKGGVGRTQALVNVGAVLAKQNKKVLLVDFDLEAPGLDSVEGLQIDKKRLGIVDFITDYRQSKGIVPELSGYISHAAVRTASTSKKNQVKLDVMLAGAPNDYRRRLVEIDWASLYKEEEGCQLFEDLRSQWKSDAYDYVLIDSRTGFTDVAGICTMQLPDCVALVMQPNLANENGILKVYESLSQQAYKRDMFIVVSNITTIDDEELVLESMFRRIKNKSNLDMYPVYRTESLGLMGNSVVAIGRPTSRIAKEYSNIASRSTFENYCDPDIALLWIRQIKTFYRIEDLFRDSFFPDEDQERVSFSMPSNSIGWGKRRSYIHDVVKAREIIRPIISYFENIKQLTDRSKEVLFYAGLKIMPAYRHEEEHARYPCTCPEDDSVIREWVGNPKYESEPMSVLDSFGTDSDIKKGISLIKLFSGQNSFNSNTDIINAEWAYQYSASDKIAYSECLDYLQIRNSEFTGPQVARVGRLIGFIEPSILKSTFINRKLIRNGINFHYLLGRSSNILLRSNEGRDLMNNLFTSEKTETVLKFYDKDLLTIKALVRALILSNTKSNIKQVANIITGLNFKSLALQHSIGRHSFNYVSFFVYKLAALKTNEIAFHLNKACGVHLKSFVEQLPLPDPSLQYFGPPREEYGHILPQQPESDIALDVAQLMLADRIEDAINLGSQLLEHWRDGIRYKFPMTLRGLEKPKRVLEWYPMSLLTLEPIPPQELKREVEYLVECAQSGNEVQWGKRRV